MKLSLFLKKDKPKITEVIACARRYFDTTVYEGERHDPFPLQAYFRESDLVVSYLSPWIIPGDLLSKTKLWNINFHPGPPEYPGIGCFNFAIYNSEQVYGATAHIMDAKVDTGKIIGVRRFPLLESDSVLQLSMRTYDEMLLLYREILEYIAVQKTLPQSSEGWRRRPYKRAELDSLCRISPDMPDAEVSRRIKATTYPNMPGAYIELFGQKFIHHPSS